MAGPAGEPAPPAPRIGRYETGRELGRGGMGIVYEAYDPLLRRKIALKVIRFDAHGTPAEQGWLRDRLLREARTAASLSHPNIVDIYDSGVDAERAYIAMELVDGPNLGRRIAAGRLNPEEALGILRQAAAALDYSHAAGVVHRDVKPGNIMLRGGTAVKIADFGIAKVTTGKDGTRTTLTAGTPSYMSPEQIRNRPVDGRTDQFSLAVVAFEMLTGVRPFDARSDFDLMKAIVDGARPAASRANAALPAAVDRVFGRALARSGKGRYHTCGEFAGALEQALSGGGPARRGGFGAFLGAAALAGVAWLAGPAVVPKQVPRSLAVRVPALDPRHAALNVDFERLGLRTEAYMDHRPSNPNRAAGATGNRDLPSQVRGLSEVAAISGGWGNSLAVESDGSLWSWGWNDAGQVGDGSLIDRPAPFRVRVPAPVRFRMVAAGAGDSLALAEDGAVWAWGGSARQTLPIPSGLVSVTTIAAGQYHALAIGRDGGLWTWGLGATPEAHMPSMVLHRVPSRVPGLSGIVAIAAGDLFSLAANQDGQVWAWGSNAHGQLGDGTNIYRPTPVRIAGLSGVKALAAGPHHSVALKNDGTVWTWGPNSYGELGDGTVTERWTPVKVPALDNVVAIAASAQHTLAVKRDGTVWGWGQNSYGVLGDGSWIDRHTPVRAKGISGVTAIASGGQHMLARKSDGTLWTWGWNDYGQLGPQAIRGLDSVGSAEVTINYAQSSGPFYSMAGSGFPWILYDRAARRILLQPGKYGDSQWGAALGYDVPGEGQYAIHGAFQRANTFPKAGDGVDAAIVIDTGDARPLWSRHIDPRNLARVPFSVRARLRRGQVVRFVVFSGPRGEDGNFDETALEASIDWQ